MNLGQQSNGRIRDGSSSVIFFFFPTQVIPPVQIPKEEDLQTTSKQPQLALLLAKHLVPQGCTYFCSLFYLAFLVSKALKEWTFSYQMWPDSKIRPWTQFCISRSRWSQPRSPTTHGLAVGLKVPNPANPCSVSFIHLNGEKVNRLSRFSSC